MVGTLFDIVVGILIIILIVAMIMRANAVRKIRATAGALVNDRRYQEALQIVIQDSSKDGWKFDRAVKYLIDNGIPTVDAQPNLERVVRQWRIEYELQQNKS